MARIIVAGIAGLLLVLPAHTPTFAQDVQQAEEPGSTDQDTIVVTGQPAIPPRSAVYRQAQEVSRISAYQVDEEALPRFEVPVCPQVTGLADAVAIAMVQRMRDTIARLGLALADEECTANLVVGFVEDGRRSIERLNSHQPWLRARFTDDEWAELSAPAPVHVLSNIDTRWSDGRPLPRNNNRQLIPSVRGQMNRLFLPTRRDILFSLVIFNRESTIGMTVEQLADYATMRGLTHTRPATGDEPMGTILSLFDLDDLGEPELTAFDIGYLQSLYYWRPDLPAISRFGRVHSRASRAARDAE